MLENETSKVKIHLTAEREGVRIDLGAGGPRLALRA